MLFISPVKYLHRSYQDGKKPEAHKHLNRESLKLLLLLLFKVQDIKTITAIYLSCV